MRLILGTEPALRDRAAACAAGTDLEQTPAVVDDEKPSDAPPQKQTRKPFGRPRFELVVWAILLAGLWGWMSYVSLDPRETLSYSAFKQALAEGRIISCQVGPDEIQGVLRGSEAEAVGEDTAVTEADAVNERPFRTVRVEDPELLEELRAAGVEVTGTRPGPWPQLLIWLLPMGLLVVFWLYVLRRASGGMGQAAMTFGKSRAQLVADRDIQVRFRDVAGCDEAKAELAEVVDFLQHPERFTKVGAKIPKGVLLVGPPGTGKTLLARAVAGEAAVPFFSLSGSDFVEMFVGVGAARVRDLFDQAKQHAPCIVFIDELDAIGRARGVRVSNVNDEREHTLNQLLVEMDGFEANAGVILLSATNRPDVLDAALLRPGRFDRQVVLDSPDVTGREAILEVHARNKPLAPGVELGLMARSTPGFSGADLANAMNEAALSAARRGASEITQADLEEAVEKVVAGPERKSRRLDRDEKRRVAYHESGHALVASLSPQADPVRKISIVPRGRAALGYTLQLPTGDQYLLTRSALFDKIRSLLGGRAAEELAFGEVSTGAENDLEQATNLARSIVARFGMGESVRLLHCGTPQTSNLVPAVDGYVVRDCSERTASMIDEEAGQLLDQLYQEARQLLEKHRDGLDRVATALLARETLDESEFRALANGSGPAAAEAPVTP
jgi:cell division protease FtsH